MKKTVKRPPAFRAAALRIGGLVLSLWLLTMLLLTWAVASHMRQELKNKVSHYMLTRENASATHTETAQPVPARVAMINKLGAPYSQIHLDTLLPFVKAHWESFSSTDSNWGNWSSIYGFEIAELYRDSQGNILARSGDYLTFQYATQPAWQQALVLNGQYAYAELHYAPEDRPVELPSGRAIGYPEILRMTGWFENEQFHPTTIENGYVTPDANKLTSDLERLMRLDHKGFITWDPWYSQPAPEGQALETIYCWNCRPYFSPLKPVTADRTEYADLIDFYLSGKYFETDMLSAGVFSHTVYPKDMDIDYSYTIIVYYWPLQYAAQRLIPTYLGSFALVALCLALLLWQLRRRLLKPIAQLAEFGVADTEDAWAEPFALEQQFTENRQALAEANTELQQLRTALFYAQNAEESRKTLVSSIAHELKTPLAVIHSYAEGLQAGIAPEKQEKYLSTILSEAEKMDGMVLQMLDLSRLEAGKVRLSAAPVSLSALTRSIVDKFAPMLEEKRLTVSFDLVSSFTVMADESRMEQVITNLLSNAVKYTPEGGQIHIKIFTHAKQARFLMENTSPHLSQEALEKVWDSFYRADPSRSEPGTGLGLALVKRVVELHRGTCSVRNCGTEPTSVEFGFSLPLL